MKNLTTTTIAKTLVFLTILTLGAVIILDAIKNGANL
jgi:hypothetical protein